MLKIDLSCIVCISNLRNVNSFFFDLWPDFKSVYPRVAKMKRRRSQSCKTKVAAVIKLKDGKEIE